MFKKVQKSAKKFKRIQIRMPLKDKKERRLEEKREVKVENIQKIFKIYSKNIQKYSKKFKKVQKSSKKLKKVQKSSKKFKLECNRKTSKRREEKKREK